MTRIRRIFADLIRSYLPDPRRPRSILMRLKSYKLFSIPFLALRCNQEETDPTPQRLMLTVWLCSASQIKCWFFHTKPQRAQRKSTVLLCFVFSVSSCEPGFGFLTPSHKGRRGKTTTDSGKQRICSIRWQPGCFRGESPKIRCFLESAVVLVGAPTGSTPEWPAGGLLAPPGLGIVAGAKLHHPRQHPAMSYTEEDAKLHRITPALQAAGWGGHHLTMEYAITAGQIVLQGDGHRQLAPSYADYRLRYSRDAADCSGGGQRRRRILRNG